MAAILPKFGNLSSRIVWLDCRLLEFTRSMEPIMRRHNPSTLRVKKAMPFRNRIKELRKSRDWSMEKLAEVIGGSTSTVNRLENGSTELVSDWLPKLSAAFSVPWTDIVWYEDNGDQAGLAEDALPFDPPDGHPLADVR